MNTTHTVPKGEASSTDLLENRVLIEKIAGNCAKSLSGHIVQTVGGITGVMSVISTLLGEKRENFSKRAEDLAKEVTKESVTTVHNAVAEKLQKYAGDTELLKLLEATTNNDTKKKLKEIQSDVVDILAPVVEDAAGQVIKKLTEEFFAE